MRRRAALLLTTVPVVGLLLGLSGCSSGSAAMISSYRTGASDTQLVVRITTGACDEIDEPEVEESSTEVVVSILVDPAGPDEPCDTIAPQNHDITVDLEQPLGTRAVRAPDQDGPATRLPA
jgi:hypothetical protein